MYVLFILLFFIYKYIGYIKMNGKSFLCIVIDYVLNLIKYCYCEKRVSFLFNWKWNIYEEDCFICDDNVDNEILFILYNCMIIVFNFV